MGQESKNHLCDLEARLQRAGKARALWGRGASVLPSSSLLKAGGSCNRFARDVGEGGATPSSEERWLHSETGDNRPLSQMHQREGPQGKGKADLR